MNLILDVNNEPKKKRKKAKQKSKSPTSRTNELLRDRGYIYYITEYFTRHGGIPRRHDLFNFIDVVGIHVGKQELLAIQTTSYGNLKARIKKAEGLPAYWGWLMTGNPVEFHGWKKMKNGKWDPCIVRVEKPSWV